MKNLRYLSVIIIVFLSVTLCYSQNFKAKDGLSSAISNSGLTNAELMVCGTFNGTVQGVPLPLTFDINSGLANIWLYYLRSADDNNLTKMMAVSKLLNNFVSVSIPVNQLLDSLPFQPGGSLNDIQWIDSDVMAQNLRNSTDYQNYKNLHSDAAISLVTLSYNGDYPYVPIGSAYWLAKIDAANTTSLICAVNAVNGEVICFDEPSAVNEFTADNNELKIYPNPAKNNIFIALPEGISYINNKLEILNSAGELVFSSDINEFEGFNLITLPVLMFPNGQYFIKINNNSGVLSGKFIIEK